MKRRPKVIAFDVIETLFVIDPLEQKLSALGLPPGALALWFTRLLRDAFALEVTGFYQPFAAVASGALDGLLREKGLEPDPGVIDAVLAGFAELPPHPDVRGALKLARAGGVRTVALTNGSLETTRALFCHAALEDQVEQFLTIDEVRHWKPAREVYLYAAQSAGVEPNEVALVAAHDWDIHGASAAGLTTGFVARKQPRPSPALREPDVTARTLDEVVRQLLALNDQGGAV